MTNGIFLELSKEQVAHTSMSRVLVDDVKTAAWVDLQTETILLGGAHQCEALDRWPGSESKRETGTSIGFHNPGQTSLYEEIKKKPEKIQNFGLAMELFSSGEGYEVSSLVEGYAWEALGAGTVVDVSPLYLSVSFKDYLEQKIYIKRLEEQPVSQVPPSPMSTQHSISSCKTLMSQTT
jgi:hypothetical protein